MKPASIAIDATLWDEPTTGIALYTHQLVQALEREGVAVRRVGARLSGEVPRALRTSRTAFTLGALPVLLRRLDEPLYHAVANFNLPLRRVPGKKLILTVHDLIPLLLPRTVSFAYRMQFRTWLGRSLDVADRVITVSDTTRRDLLERYPIDPEKVRAIPLGVDHVDAVPPPDDTGKTYLDTLALPERYVLYAGALDARKNVELVLDACARLGARGAPATLVLAGQRWFGAGSVERKVAQLRAAGLDLRPLGYQPAPLFFELIRRAGVFVFPSRYEGFGLPPLEAMRLGVPVVVSRCGALPEVCGDAALSIDPDDADGLADAIATLRADGAERTRRIQAGHARAAGFTWQRTARETLEVYAAALEG